MAARTLSPEQREKKRIRDRERLALKRANAQRQKSAAAEKTEEKKEDERRRALKRERDKRYRAKKKAEREKEQEKGKPAKKEKTEEQRKEERRRKARKRAKKYREALKQRQKELPASFAVKQKLWFLYRETWKQKLGPCRFRVVVDKMGQISARLTVVNRELNFFDVNEWISEPFAYDELLKQGFLQGFAAFLEMTSDGQLITSPPRASRASAGGVYRHHAETWWYDLFYDIGQVPRCMGTSEQMVRNVEESSKGGLAKDTFGINYNWTVDRTRPERDQFGLWK